MWQCDKHAIGPAHRQSKRDRWLGSMTHTGRLHSFPVPSAWLQFWPNGYRMTSLPVLFFASAQLTCGLPHRFTAPGRIALSCEAYRLYGYKCIEVQHIKVQYQCLGALRSTQEHVDSKPLNGCAPDCMRVAPCQRGLTKRIQGKRLLF